MLAELDVGLMRELRAILSMYLGILLAGYSMGFSAVAVPDIKEEMRSNNHSYYNIPTVSATEEELSWFVSSINIGLIVGNLLGGYCGGRFGPRKAVMASCVPNILAWIIIATSPNIASLIVGRVLCGLSASSCNIPLLVAQYSSVKRRGGFLSLYALMLGLGILTSYCLGALLYWRLVSSVPPILYLLLFLLLWRIPESPLWLLSHRGTEVSREALQWIRGTEDVSEELEEIQALKEQQSHGLTMTEAIRNLRRPDVRTPFLLITFNCILVMLSGPFAIIFYSVEIFQNTGVGIDEYLASIIVASIRVIGGIIGIFLVQRLPRVRLSMVTMSLMSLSMAVLGTALYLKTLSISSPVLDVITVVSVTAYMFCYGAGAEPLQFVFLGELLPREYKVLAGLISSLATVAIFIITQIFPSLLTILSPHGTYWLFAAISLSSNIFYYFFMPETRGKTAREIKQIFEKRKENLLISK